MRFKRHEDDRGGQFELISMTDIVFLLLIFFMISSAFVDLGSHLDIQLPETAVGEDGREAPEEQKARTHLIEMGIRDELFLDGTPLRLPEIVAKLAESHMPDSQDSVLIKADARLSHGEVMGVLHVLQQKTKIRDFQVAVR